MLEIKQFGHYLDSAFIATLFMLILPFNDKITGMNCRKNMKIGFRALDRQEIASLYDSMNKSILVRYFEQEKSDAMPRPVQEPLTVNSK